MAVLDTVRCGNIEMDYCKFGNGQRTFVVIPGLSIQSVLGAAADIEAGFAAFQDEFTTFVFDRRKEVQDPYSVYDMAKDTVEAIKALGLSDIYLFGASQGGMIAMTIAIEHPELVKKMAIASTSPRVTKEQYEGIQSWIDLAKKGDKEGLYLSYGERIYPPAVFEQFRDYFIETSKSVTDEELAKFIIVAAGMKDFNVSDRLDQIQCPVLTTGTFEDAVLDSDSTMEIAEKLDEKQGFKLYMYTGFGHASFDTAPDYRQRVMKFFLDEKSEKDKA